MIDRTRVTQLRRTFAVVLAGLIVTTLGGWAAISVDRDAVARALQAQADVHTKIIESRFSDLEHPVLSAADFVAADRDRGPKEFLRFAGFAAPHAPIVRWLGWAPLVRGAERAAFEAAARPAYTRFDILDRIDGVLTPAPERAVYFPLYAVRNFQGGHVPLGLDLAGNPEKRAAAAKARDQGRVIATGPMASADGSGSGEVTLMIAPIFRDGVQALMGVAERRRNLMGYVVGAYGIDAMLRFVTSGVVSRDERISFGQPAPAAHFGEAVAATRHNGTTASFGPPLPEPNAGEYRIVEPMQFSGQSWTATFAFSPHAAAKRHSYAPFGWIGAGLLLTAALGTMTARGETQRLATERLVAIRTRELSAANERLHQTAQTLETTLAAAPLGIIALDAEGRIMQWNHGAERLFDHAAAEVLGASYFDLVVPAQHRGEADALFNQIGEGEPLQDIEVQWQRRDGALLDIRVAGSPLHDVEGRMRGVVLASQDVSESRKLEERLRQAEKMEAIGQLTGGVAHDFNNLLGTAITSLDLLHDRVKNDAESNELATDALDALLHGADLVRRLLAFARRQPLQPEHVRVNGLVLEAVRLLRPLLGDAIEIALDLGDPVWPVLVDRGQFETTLINLATNARDAMPHGGRLGIATRNAQVAAQDPARDAGVPPGPYVVVEVRDTGIGMPPELRQRIFEPFFTTKGKSVGTGLGLSTVLGFIEQSGGHIAVESEPGHGSLFRLYLPRQSEEGVDDHDAGPSAAPAAVPGSRGERVLVVEDNAGLRHMVLYQLRKLGYRAAEAEDATRALALLESGEPADLLFTDVMLPGSMTGIELAAVARSRWPELKVLLTSGFPEALFNEPSPVAGLRLISKPYREEELAAVLRDVLGR